MKAILVVDIGNDDIDSYEVCVRKANRDTEIEWEKEAKLRPLPERWEAQMNGLSFRQRVENWNFAEGWNACLRRIEDA